MNRRAWIAAAPLVLAGCLSHMPPDRDPLHLHIDWLGDFEAAREAAAEGARPLLVVMVAGDIQERC